MKKVIITEPIYNVEVNGGYDGHGTKIEQYILDKLGKYHNQVVTWSVMQLINSEIERLHEDFLSNNPRLKKDVDYQYKIIKDKYDEYPFILLGSRNGAASIRFKPILSILTAEGIDELPIKEV